MLLIQSEYRFRTLILEESRTDTVKYCQYGVSVMSCVARLEEKVGEAPPVSNGHSQNELHPRVGKECTARAEAPGSPAVLTYLAKCLL